MTTCSIDGCTSPRHRRDWCNIHYRRWLRHGDPQLILVQRNNGAGCTVEGCGTPARTKGMCDLHYQRWLLHGDPRWTDGRVRGVCTFDGCEQPQDSNGWCVGHYQPRVIGGGGTRGECAIDGCTAQIYSRAWCNVHYQRWLKHGDPARTDLPRHATDAERVAAKRATFRANGQLRRLYKLGNGPYDVIDVADLYDRDGGICHLCGGGVDYSGHDLRTGWSVDHVIPLSKGGPHTWDNVKLAHRACNARKRDRMPD